MGHARNLQTIYKIYGLIVNVENFNTYQCVFIGMVEKKKGHKHAEYQRNREKYVDRRDKYYQTHKVELIAKAHERWEKIKKDPVLMAKRKAYRISYNAKNHKKILEKHRIERERLRMNVLLHYTQDMLQCARCGFSDVRALTVDHINGGGSQDRKKLRGVAFYKKIINACYPPIYQVLCMNCQFIKAHEREEF